MNPLERRRRRAAIDAAMACVIVLLIVQMWLLTATLEDQRTDALRRLTDAHRKLLELSPYRTIRARYEELSSIELIPAVRDHDPIPSRYRNVKSELETSLLEAGASGLVTSERATLEALRDRYEEALTAWEADGARTEEAGRALDVA